MSLCLKFFTSDIVVTSPRVFFASAPARARSPLVNTSLHPTMTTTTTTTTTHASASMTTRANHRHRVVRHRRIVAHGRRAQRAAAISDKSAEESSSSSSSSTSSFTTTTRDDDDIAGNPYEQTTEAANERRELFNEIAPVYDALNDALSLGLHRAWKRAAVKWIGASSGMEALDVCCGSGDVALKLSSVVGGRGDGKPGRVVGLDFAANQLERAAEKERTLRSADASVDSKMAPIDWIEGDALSLPFEDDSFDCATIAYGLRNVSDIPRALRELRRVLRPGAKLAVLDFNNPSDSTTAAVQGFVLDNVVVPIADFNGVAAEYRYLRPSIERFPRGPEQVDLARDAGFREATHYELSPGNLMGCLVCTK